MNNLERDAEQALSSGGGGNNNQEGNTGGGMAEDAMKDFSGGGGNNMGGGNQSGGSSGVDGEVNEVVDKVASSEGVPGIADSMINKDVDAEVNKFV